MDDSCSPYLPSWLQHLDQQAQIRKIRGIHRLPREVRHLSPTRIEWDGQSLIHFASNDYLGLSWNSTATEFEETYASAEPPGSGASPLISGRGPAMCSLETQLADFKKCEACAVFSSGYAANLGTVSGLVGREDLVFSDSLNHASLIDGCRLSRATVSVYAHNNLEDLRERVRSLRHQSSFAFLVTDSVFSMDGDLAPLRELCQIASEYDLVPLVDEAHALGIYGVDGSGLVEEMNLEAHIPVRVGTMSKAMGCQGGFVVGPNTVIGHVHNHARSWIYSTALSPYLAQACRTNLARLRSMKAERQALRKRSLWLRTQLQALGLDVPQGDSPILPIRVHSAGRAMACSAKLRESGVYVAAIRPPTVPEGGSMLRISITSLHQDSDYEQLLHACATL